MAFKRHLGRKKMDSNVICVMFHIDSFKDNVVRATYTPVIQGNDISVQTTLLTTYAQSK